MEQPSDTLERAFELARELQSIEETRPVAPNVTPEEALSRLDLAIGHEGVSDDQLFETMRAILELTPRTTTRKFFNQLFAGRDAHATSAEMLASMLNISMYTYKVAGPHVLLERLLTRRMADIAGFSEGEGVFAPGGSVSNFYAMVMARNEAAPEIRDDGFAGDPLTMYTSDVSHYSIVKNASLTGIGRSNVRLIPTDAQGRMIPAALRQTIARDLRSDAKPFLINATAGTTVLGAFDPIDAIADIAEEFGIWLHIDGALGGSTLLSERHSGLMTGHERADSLTWDAHKMLGVPLLCSVVLTKRPGMLEKHFTQDASYLFQTDREYAHGNMSMQCGRRNDAFKLWAMWKRRGDAGLAARVDRVFGLAQYCAEIVRSDPRLTLSKEPQSVNVCFEVTGRSSEAICDALREQEQCLVGYGIVDRRKVIRLACVNPATTEADLDEFFETALRVSEDFPPVDNACDRETDLDGAEYVEIGADGGCSSCS